MADLVDDTAKALDIARRLLRKARQTESVEVERQFVREVEENLAVAAQGLLEAVQQLQQRIDDLDELAK